LENSLEWIYNYVLEEPIASSKLANGIGERIVCNVKTSTKIGEFFIEFIF